MYHTVKAMGHQSSFPWHVASGTMSDAAPNTGHSPTEGRHRGTALAQRLTRELLNELQCSRVSTSDARAAVTPL